MIKRFLALALCFVVVFCDIVSFAVNAEEERPTVYTLSIISNEMNDDCINGYMYGDETFISIDDVCTLTRSTFDIDKSKVNLYHGVMEVQIDTSENKITFWNQSTDFETKRYKDKILVKPYAILELLCARCSYIDDDKVLCVLMPSITIYEALDFDLYNKCYYNIYKGDEFNTIVRATSALFSDVAFDGVGNFFNMLVESFSFNGSDRYIDRALIEISDVKISKYASVENQMNQTLENRNKAVECVEKASEYSEGVGSLASAYVDILEKTIGNSDSSINIATKALSKTANIVDYLSLIKSAEEKLDYDLDSFELIGKVVTEENIGSIEGTDYIIERADYISETLESRLAQYFETTEQKVREKAFEKIIKDSAKILDKGSKYPIGEISAFILSCEIGTTVTKLLMNDEFEAWDADMNAIMLSEIQNTMYDVIRNKYTNCFANYDNAIEFVDALNLYNRTSIAMYSNLKKADEEFDIYVESFTGKFSGECDRMCEKLALNTYNLHSCNLEEDICSLEDFKKYYDNDMTKNVDITEPEEQLPAILQTVYENEKMWLDNINDLATEYSDVQFGHNECWFQDLDMDGTPEFIVGGMGLGLSEAISQVYHIYKYSNGELKQIQVNNNKFLEVTWDGKSPNYGSAGFELIQQFINNKTNSIVLTEEHKYNYTSGPAGGVISFSDYKISGTQLKSDSNYIVYCSVDGNGEITGNYRVHTQEDETDEKSFIKTYDDFFADLTPYKTTIKAVPCSDESIDMPNNYDQMTDEEKKQALLDSYNAWSYEVDIDAELPLESYIDKLRDTSSSTTGNSEAETAYYKFIASELIPEYGWSDLNSVDVDFTVPPVYDNWYGVISGEICEIDGKDYLLTVVLKEVDETPHLFLTLYGYNGYVYQIQNYDERMSVDTVGFDVSWNNGYLVVSVIHHFNYSSSRYGSFDTILSIDSTGFDRKFSLVYAHFMGGACTIGNRITEETYYQTDGLTDEGLQEALTLIGNEISSLGISDYEIGGEYGEFWCIINPTERICKFDIYEEDLLNDYTDIRKHVSAY